MIPGLNKFHQLPTIPGNFYYNVREVRTSDDTMLTVKVMLFYKMEDVLKMLDTTHDPVADLINALCADVISFVGPLTYQKFVESTSQLSDLDIFPQLRERAERVGFKVEKVVFRGYHASDQLQEMQNVAIESRTQLRLQREIEDQEQKLSGFKLNKLQERSCLEQAMEIKKQTHRQKMSELQHKQKLEMEDMKLKQQLELSNLEAQVNLEHKNSEYKQKISHLGQLNEVKVDLSKYLTLEYNTPAQDEIIVATHDHLPL
ncbi:hypothetical protein BsWGS_16842 [Bradybaena similaris]